MLIFHGSVHLSKGRRAPLLVNGRWDTIAVDDPLVGYVMWNILILEAELFNLSKYLFNFQGIQAELFNFQGLFWLCDVEHQSRFLHTSYPLKLFIFGLSSTPDV